MSDTGTSRQATANYRCTSLMPPQLHVSLLSWDVLRCSEHTGHVGPHVVRDDMGLALYNVTDFELSLLIRFGYVTNP